VVLDVVGSNPIAHPVLGDLGEFAVLGHRKLSKIIGNPAGKADDWGRWCAWGG